MTCHFAQKRCISWDWPPQFCTLIGVALCDGLYLWQKEVSLMRGKTILIYGYKDKYLDYN